MAVLRALLIAALVLGTLLPRMGAAVAEALPGWSLVPICVGDEIVWMHTGPDGIPVEVDGAAAHDCVATALPMAEEPARTVGTARAAKARSGAARPPAAGTRWRKGARAPPMTV